MYLPWFQQRALNQFPTKGFQTFWLCQNVVTSLDIPCWNFVRESKYFCREVALQPLMMVRRLYQDVGSSNVKKSYNSTYYCSRNDAASRRWQYLNHECLSPSQIFMPLSMLPGGRRRAWIEQHANQNETDRENKTPNENAANNHWFLPQSGLDQT